MIFGNTITVWINLICVNKLELNSKIVFSSEGQWVSRLSFRWNKVKFLINSTNRVQLIEFFDPFILGHLECKGGSLVVKVVSWFVKKNYEWKPEKKIYSKIILYASYVCITNKSEYDEQESLEKRASKICTQIIHSR